MYIGTSDPEQTTYTYACDGDSILVQEVTLGRESNYTEHKLLSKKVYSLSELRKRHDF
jgi:YD repeat-containing protein